MTAVESDGMLLHLIMFILEEHIIRDQQHVAQAKVGAILDAWTELTHALAVIERSRTDRCASTQRRD